jgi:hypothetical protein
VYFNLEAYLCIDGTGIISKGSFKARNKSEIPLVAYGFIRDIKRETGFRPTLIEKIIVNGTEDITEEVKKMEHIPFRPLDQYRIAKGKNRTTF